MKPPPRGRVLVVDDDVLIRRVFAALLQRSGHEVLTASSGEEALSRLQQTEVDVAIVDLRMPGMHGLEVCAESGLAGRKWPSSSPRPL